MVGQHKNSGGVLNLSRKKNRLAKAFERIYEEGKYYNCEYLDFDQSKYHLGLNTASDSVVEGFCFTTLEQIHNSCLENCYICTLRIPDDAVVYVDNPRFEMYKSNKVIVEEMTLVRDFKWWHNPAYCAKVLETSPQMIEYLKIDLAAHLDKSGLFLLYSDQIPKTSKNCLQAVKNNGFNLG